MVNIYNLSLPRPIMELEILRIVKDEKNPRPKLREIMDSNPSIDLGLIRDRHGETLLHWASTRNDVELIQYLLDVKASCYVNDGNYYLATPLYYAVTKNALEAVRYLLSRGADPRLQSGFTGKNSIQIAQNLEIKTLLEEKMNQQNKGKEHSCIMYQYRTLDWWRTTYLQLISPNKQNMFLDFPTCQKAKTIGTNNLRELLDLCIQMDQSFWNDVNSYIRNIFMDQKCLSCGAQDDLQVCSRCKKVRFCDQKCQTEAWVVHKIDCKK